MGTKKRAAVLENRAHNALRITAECQGSVRGIVIGLIIKPGPDNM
jgi:hypothetical protein